MRNSEHPSSEIVFYCTKCFSLHILGNDDRTDIWCETCGRRHSGPQDIDVATMDKWEKLYREAKGHGPLDPEPSPYDDWRDVYETETETEQPSKQEVLAAGLNYSEIMNRKITD